MGLTESHIKVMKTWVELAHVRVNQGYNMLALFNIRRANQIADHILEEHKDE